MGERQRAQQRRAEAEARAAAEGRQLSQEESEGLDQDQPLPEVPEMPSVLPATLMRVPQEGAASEGQGQVDSQIDGAQDQVVDGGNGERGAAGELPD